MRTDECIWCGEVFDPDPDEWVDGFRNICPTCAHSADMAEVAHG